MAMAPGMTISSAKQVIVGARISKCGNAMPQPGDLAGEARQSRPARKISRCASPRWSAAPDSRPLVAAAPGQTSVEDRVGRRAERAAPAFETLERLDQLVDVAGPLQRLEALGVDDQHRRAVVAAKNST